MSIPPFQPGNPPNGLGERHTTQSQGLADIRLAGGYWLFNPQTHPFNYSVAVGIKLPTGKYDYTDTFYNQGTNKDQDIEAVVDQSIQPGDGAYGFTIDVQGFHPLSQHFVWSSNLYYMLSPQESNGMLTRTGTSEYSCPDQFSVRTGIFYNAFSNWNAFLGMRCEGVPSKDIIGGSDGFRRPGYAVSAEPSIGYNKNRLALQLSVPFALYRNRTQSYLDKQRTEETGVYTQGDAAFADYLINVNAAYRFSKNHKKMKLLPTKTENE
ncbi:MAG: transporter [Sphingobacteriales bacterium]|nr:transporter [Sphingobacteriales bacterium]